MSLYDGVVSGLRFDTQEITVTIPVHQYWYVQVSVLCLWTSHCPVRFFPNL